MKLIIDIHEKDYKSILNRRYVSGGAVDAIMHGTPLDKHDEEVIAETVESIWGKPPYMDMLDKIKSEIKHYNLQPSNYPCDMISIGTVLQIIDKYRGEQCPQ